MSNTIKVSVLGDVRDINNKLGKVNSQLGGFGKSMGKVSTLAKGLFAGFVATKVVSGLKSVVSAASDAEQSLGATETVFGKFANRVVKDSDRAAKQFGLSANEYRQNANLIGSLFSNQGVAQDKLAGSTKNMIGVAADLSATFGGTTTEAVQSLGAAYKGEFDSLEKYGISLKQSQVNAEAAALSQKKYGKELSSLNVEQQKAINRQATQNLIMKQSAKTRGAFAKESNTLAHQQQVLGAQFDNLKVKLGTALLPVITKVLTVVNDNFVPAIEAIGAVLGPVVDKVQAFFSGAGEGQSKLAPLSDFIKGQLLPAVMGIGQAFVDLWAVVQPIITQLVGAITSQWGAVQPYVNQIWTSVKEIIVTALEIIKTRVKQITTVVTVLWNTFGSTIVSYVRNAFRNVMQIVGGVMRTLAGVVKLVLAIMKGDWKGAWNAIKQIVSGVLQVIKGVISQSMNTLKSMVSAAWTAVKALTSAAWEGIKSVIKTQVNTTLGIVRGIPGAVKSALGNLGSLLLNAGSELIGGFIKGIESKFDSVKGTLGNLTGKLTSWKGPPKRDKSLLTPAGRLIMKGLVKGFDEGRKGVKDSLGDLTNLIEKHFDKRYKNEKKASKASKRAIHSLAGETKALMKNARKRERVYKRLERAQKRINDLRDKAQDYKTSVIEGVLGYTDVTGIGAAFNTDAMLAELNKRLEKVKDFAALVKRLKNQGLNKTMIDQIVQAGVEGGLATATALAEGGPEAIKEFNDLQSEINKAASGLGTTGAKSMYQSGIDSVKGFIKGLRSQKQALQKWARNLAKQLSKAVKDALGIKSPSTVFKRIGKYTVEGLQIGLEDTRKVKTAMVNLSDVMTSSFEPRLATAASAGGSGGNTYQITVHAPVGASSADIGRELVGHIKQYERIGGRK